MTDAVQKLLESFDALSDPEKREAAARLLHRVVEGEPGDIPEDELVAATEDLLLDLDARETSAGSGIAS